MKLLYFSLMLCFIACASTQSKLNTPKGWVDSYLSAHIRPNSNSYWMCLSESEQKNWLDRYDLKTKALDAIQQMLERDHDEFGVKFKSYKIVKVNYSSPSICEVHVKWFFSDYEESGYFSLRKNIKGGLAS